MDTGQYMNIFEVFETLYNIHVHIRKKHAIGDTLQQNAFHT